MDAVSSGTAKLRLPVKDKRLEDILLWRDPKKSGICLGGATAMYWGLNHISYNPVVVLANLAQLAVIACFLWNTAAKFLKKPGVPVPKAVAEGISEAEAKSVAVRASVYVNKVLALVERIISGKDVVLTLQVAGALFVVARVASVVSLLTLAWLGVVALFTLPKLYELKKDEIDGGLHKAKEQYNTVYNKHVDPIMKKIPRASTASGSTSAPSASDVAGKVDEVANEVQSMNEGRKY